MEEENKKENVEETEQKDEINEETEELDQEEFTYNVDNNNINNDYNKTTGKSSYIYILIGFLILVIIIITLVVIVNKKEKKASGYSDVETKLVNAAKKYYQKYPEQLQQNEENVISIEAEKLIQNSYLKPFSEMVDKNVECTGYVKIYKNEESYSYFPYLNCGNAYKSKKLNEKIIEENLVGTESGLYKENNEYIFKGEYVNNYVKFNNEIWRILKINDDGSIKMILINKKPEKMVWDDRYNVERSGNTGKNDFSISRILEDLNKAYKEHTYINKENTEFLVKKDWCIGKIPEEGIEISNLNLCTETYKNLYIGLINVEEVLKPSLEENCKKVFDGACRNYNYLSTVNIGWTINAGSNKTYTVYNANQASVTVKNASTSSVIRPVININPDTLYKDGDGTETKPYIVQK